MLFLTGVHSEKQFKKLNLNSLLGSRRLIAADLFAKLNTTDNTELRNLFFERFKDHRGAYKNL